MKRLFTFILFVSSFVFSNADVTPNLVLPIGHTDRINSIDFSPDGKLMATGSDDGYMKVWDVETGLLLKMVKGHGLKSKISEIKFFPDGNKIAFVSQDDSTRKSKLLVYSINQNSIIWESEATTHYVSKLIYSISNQNNINYYMNGVYKRMNFEKNNITTYQLKYNLHCLIGNIHITSKLSIRDTIINKNARLSNQKVKRLIVPRFRETLVTSGSNIAVSKFSDSVMVWDYNSRLIINKFALQNKKVSLCLSMDGHSLFTLMDSIIITYSIIEGTIINSVNIGKISSNSISLNPNGLLAIGMIDGSVFYYNIQKQKIVKVFRGKTVLIKEVGFVRYRDCPIGHLASTYLDTSFFVWDIKTGNIIKNHNLRIKGNGVIKISKNGAYPMVCYEDSFFLWNIINDSILRREIVSNYIDWHFFKPVVSNDAFNVLVISLKGNGNITLFDYRTLNKYRMDFYKKSIFSNLSFHDSSEYISMTKTSLKSSNKKDGILIYEKLNIKKRIKKISGLFGEFSPDKNGSFAVVSGSKWENNIFSYPFIIIYDTKNWKKKFELLGHKGDIMHLSFSSDGKKLLSSSRDNTIHLWDVETGKLIRVLKGAHTNTVTSAYFSQDNLHIVSTGEDHKTIVWDAETGKALYTRIQLENDNWLVYDEHYRYDGTEEARNLLYLTCGTEIIDLLQMKDALYVPGLVSLIMKGQPINYPKISDLHVCGVLPLVEILSENDSFFHFKINPRSSELKGVEVYINNKLVQTVPKEELLGTNEGYELVLQKDNLKLHFLSGMENKVTVVGITEEKGIQLRSRNLNVLSFGEPKVKAASPKLYALFVGVNEYKDPNISLNFPAKDASDLGHAVELSAKKFLGDTNVVVYYVYTNNGNKEIYNTPEKEGIRKAIADIASKAKPEDIVMIFFAGHGVMQGNQDKYFTFLTAEASRENLIGISTQELQSWLSYDGPNKMLANKTILIFDACNSGQATKELMAFARNDDETRRVRQIEDLKDKSGMFILSASAPDQSAYEHPQYMQGLLTYSLLYTLKNNPEILEEGGYLNVQKWFLSAEKHLQHIIEHLGLKQQAQPMGTSNIRIGEVDDVVRNSIVLAEEKPIIMCANVTNDSMGYDYLELKGKLNRMLSIMSNDPSNSFVYLASENNSVNMLTISYEDKGDKVICKITLIKRGKLLYKGKVEGLSSDLDALIIKIIDEVSVYAQN